MSKFSSYKQSQLLFENWRKHVNEGEEQLEIPLGKGKPEVVDRPGGSLETIKAAVEEYRAANVPEGDETLQYNVGSVLDDIMRSVEELERMESLPSEEDSADLAPEPGEPKLKRPRLGEQQELDEQQSKLPELVKGMINRLKSMESENSDAFSMAMGAFRQPPEEGV